MIDSATGIETICTYDSAGRVLVMAEIYSPYHYREVVYTYDTNGNVTKLEEIVTQPKTQNHFTVLEQAIYGYDYFYDHKNRIEAIETNDSRKEYQYDSLDRVTQEIVSSVDGEGSTEVLRNEYTYANATVNGTSVTTYQVASKETTADMYQNEWIYEYDGNGNIVSIRDGTGSGARAITYVYDSADQLIRENNPYVNTTWVWTYDGAGNITSKKEYAYTTDAVGSVRSSINYGYPQGDESWGDLLIAYNGQTLSYDGGNLINDGTWTYTWEQGRQLATMSDGTTTWNYTYDASGMRVGRTNGTDTYTYLYTNGLLSMMTKGDKTLYFTYDAAGMPLTVNYNDITYYYVTNLQGDVIAILDGNGYAVAEYIYNAWGYQVSAVSASSTDLCSINPLRYRGYVYDRETGLYYLQSRYYNPEIGRFISADSYMSTGDGILSNNMFAYCLNNPVNYADPTGHMPEWAKWVVGGLAVAGLVAATVLTCGAAGAGAAAVGAAMLAGGIISGGINAIDQLSDTGTIDFTELAISTLSGTAYGLVVGLTGGAAAGTFSAGAFVGKLAVAGGTSLLNSWNQEKNIKDTAISFGVAIAGSVVCQSAGYLGGKAISLIPRNPDKLFTLGDVGSYLWGIPAVKTGIIKAVGGTASAIWNDYF